MEFPRQEYWSGLPFPTSGDLPDPGIEPASPPVDSLPPSHLGSQRVGNHLSVIPQNISEFLLSILTLEKHATIIRAS